MRSLIDRIVASVRGRGSRLGVVLVGAASVIGGEVAHGQETFNNFTTITIPAGAPGTTSGVSAPYPSSVAVAGLKKGVAHVRVQIFGYSHTFPGDVTALLVGPGGQSCVLMGRCGGSPDAVDASLIFDDDATAGLPAPIVSGTYRPTTCSGSVLTAPAPGGPYGSTLGAFRGTNGNGNWSLYVQDFAGGDVGQIFGWQLSIIEAGAPVVEYQAAGTLIPQVGAAATYPLTISVSSLTGTITGVGVRLNGLTHTYLDDLDILLVSPNGDKCMIMSDAGGFGPGVSGARFGFTHNAPGPMPDNTIPPSPGTFLPTDFEVGETMPAPAPVGPYGTALSVFNGQNPNGTWSLYINDDLSGDSGLLSNWELLIYTGDRCPADFNESGALEVQDIFDFLNSWFAGCP